MTETSGADFIPPVRLDNAAAWEAVRDRLEDLVLAGRFILGPEVDEFEEAAAKTFGSEWAVGTSSGTSAIMLALRAAPLEAGSRIALPANTFYAVFEAVLQAGHVPVVVDHDPDYLISMEQLEGLDVQGVVAVHLYGLPADLGPIMRAADERGWWVLEDCSQAHGARIGERPVGSIGHAAAFSAYPTKNLGAWGDAGFVTGSDPEVRERILSLRHHAQREGNVHEGIGGSERIDALQALVLTEKIRRLDDEVAARRAIAAAYRDALADTGLDLPGDRGDRFHAYHQFVLRVPDRDGVRARLADRGIGSGVHYPTPIHLQPGARGVAEVPARPTRSEAWAPQLLSLPMYPSLSPDDQARVAAGLHEALGSR
jgi:dTDP-3-amino-3,4,6-trideoxy-alpha-D-glucose transaminase